MTGRLEYYALRMDEGTTSQPLRAEKTGKQILLNKVHPC